jgi:hypothetical protein
VGSYRFGGLGRIAVGTHELECGCIVVENGERVLTTAPAKGCDMGFEIERSARAVGIAHVNFGE